METRSRRLTARLLAFAALTATSCGAEPPEEQRSFDSDEAALGGSVAIAGHVGNDASNAGMSGVTVQLTGPVTVSTVTDSHGNFLFTSLPVGSYTLTPSKPSATITPSSVDLGNVSADQIQNFTCAGACGAGPAVDPYKEIAIIDPSVTQDARASNATGGPWSFRYLIEQMTPSGVDPADFVAEWLEGLQPLTVNGYPTSTRATTSLLNLWPTRPDGKLDLAQAPFQLRGIFNRTDLHADGSGEARLVFGIIPPNHFIGGMTVIFEYRLPNNSVVTDRHNWITRFHALGQHAFGPQYNAELQEITDLFTQRGAARSTPGNPNASALGQLRTSEDLMGAPWSWREFHLVPEPTGYRAFLRLVEAAQTPDQQLNGDPGLEAFLLANRTGIIAGVTPLDPRFLGGEAEGNIVPSATTWAFSNTDEPLRHAFAGQTCNGCHNAETEQLATFYHVAPFATPGPDGTGVLSSFVKQVEIPRRVSFMQNRLTCSSLAGDCSPGSESVAP
ncbi:carboxypeptidase-like regulatory domain-containing protein [Sorangium sp. So ce119]|uniref:carboxypeptidase-like regulatory domain-containing protein n=1 Tax=Sorangium sp. So ce119 TaxID=3133279 RepID=UPI003F5E4821